MAHSNDTRHYSSCECGGLLYIYADRDVSSSVKEDENGEKEKGQANLQGMPRMRILQKIFKDKEEKETKWPVFQIAG